MVLIILIQSKLLSCVTLFKVSHNIYIYDMSYLMTKNLLSKKKEKDLSIELTKLKWMHGFYPIIKIKIMT